MQSALPPSDSVFELDEYLGSMLGSAESKNFENVFYLIDKYSTHCSRIQKIFDLTTVDMNTCNMINKNQQWNQDVVYMHNRTQNSSIASPMATREFHHQNIDSTCMLMLPYDQQSSYMRSPVQHYPMATDQSYTYTSYNSDDSMANYYQTPTTECHMLTVDNTVALMTDNSPQLNQKNGSGMNVNDFNGLFGFDFGFSEVAHCDSNMQTDSMFCSETFQPAIVLEESRPVPVISNDFDVQDWLIESKIDGKIRRPFLHEFLRLLLDNRKYSHIAEYTDRKKGIFKFHLRDQAAKLWQDVKARNSDHRMTYDKLARAIRFHYPTGVMRATPGRFTFRFGSESGFGKNWWPAS